MDPKRCQDPLTKTDTEYFINYYLSQECLWNVSHKNYSKRDFRQGAISMIAAQMQESCGRAMTAEQITAKIASLRTYYGRELRKVNNAQKSRAATTDLYVSQWEFFHLLDPLLRSQVQKRPSVSNMIPAEKDIPENNDAFTTESTTPTFVFPDLPTKSTTEQNEECATSPMATPSKKRKQGSDSVDLNKLMINTLMQISERNKVKHDIDSDCDILFGKQVGLEIKKIRDERKRQELKLQIQTSIFQYQYESEP